jgi:hypothetical protein
LRFSDKIQRVIVRQKAAIFPVNHGRNGASQNRPQRRESTRGPAATSGRVSGHPVLGAAQARLGGQRQELEAQRRTEGEGQPLLRPGRFRTGFTGKAFATNLRWFQFY